MHAYVIHTNKCYIIDIFREATLYHTAQCIPTYTNQASRIMLVAIAVSSAIQSADRLLSLCFVAFG